MAVAELAVRARRAYERGRLGWASRRGLVGAALAAAALVACPERGGPGLCCIALGIFLAACLWRGRAWARGARLGYLAGLAPCLLPAAARAVHLCGGGACFTTPWICLPAGLLAGLTLGWRGARGASGNPFWVAALSVTLLAGSIGCLAAGLAGLVGMAAGVLAGAATPILVRRAA